ncbi:hypothetical protein [Nocardia sp. X0981]
MVSPARRTAAGWYVSTTLTDIAGLSSALVPVVLMLFGVGMVLGDTAGGVLADRGVDRSIVVAMGAMTVILIGFVAAAHHPVTAGIGALLVGAGLAFAGLLLFAGTVWAARHARPGVGPHGR